MGSSDLLLFRGSTVPANFAAGQMLDNGNWKMTELREDNVESVSYPLTRMLGNGL